MMISSRTPFSAIQIPPSTPSPHSGPATVFNEADGPKLPNVLVICLSIGSSAAAVRGPLNVRLAPPLLGSCRCCHASARRVSRDADGNADEGLEGHEDGDRRVRRSDHPHGPLEAHAGDRAADEDRGPRAVGPWAPAADLAGHRPFD